MNHSTAILAALSFEELAQRPEAQGILAQAICQRHAINPAVQRCDEGSALVFFTPDGYVLKIFPPEEQMFQRNEALFLEALAGRLPVETPELTAADHLAGFPYLVMTRLTGQPLSRAWTSVPPRCRPRLLEDLGETTRALHALPAALFSGAVFPWAPFIQDQWNRMLERHREFDLEPAWLDELARYVEAGPQDIIRVGPVVPLHTELMPQHLFVTNKDGHWTLSGLVDFEPAMTGAAEYEFAAVGVFLSCGDKETLRGFLSAYGYADKDLDAALSRRLMTWLLLHRYSRLRWFMSLLPAPQQFTTLPQLEQFWFGV